MFPYILPDELEAIKSDIKRLQKNICEMEESLKSLCSEIESLRSTPTITDGQQEAESVPELEKLSDGETVDPGSAPAPRRKARAKKPTSS